MERVVLITGAGSGIGLASALEAARLGFSVVAGVHTDDEVELVHRAVAEAHLPGGSVRAEPFDVTDEDRARALIEATRPWGLVNNAGLTNAGLLMDVPVDAARHQYEVMVFAPIRLAQLALPGMRRGGGGRIVNVSSIAADTTTPTLGWYQSAKAALTTLSDVLRQEVAHFGVEVVVVEPGLVATPIWGKAADDLRHRRERASEQHPYDKALGVLDEVTGHTGDVGKLAEVVGAALHAGHPRFRYRAGQGARALPLVHRVVPTSVRDRFARPLGGL
jgi:NAD(P)-dependent dehydrogenase (short-subunit alcohol dehydrogenase family)